MVSAALPDSLEIALLYRVSAHIDAATLVILASVALLTVFAFVPRRTAIALPGLVLALLVATSVSASTLIVPRAIADQEELVGSPRDWVERAADGNVTYLYDGEPQWNSVWQQRSYVVATDRYTFFGKPVAHHARGVDLEGLTLWRLRSPARLSTVTTGFLPNGDLVGRGTLTAYACAGGTLELTLLPKSTDVLRGTLDGAQALRRTIGGRPSWHGRVPVPSSHASTCHFTIRGGALLGSTVVAFRRA